MFSCCYAHVLQINPLLPFFHIFSGTHVHPCVQAATPLTVELVRSLGGGGGGEGGGDWEIGIPHSSPKVAKMSSFQWQMAFISLISTSLCQIKLVYT